MCSFPLSADSATCLPIKSGAIAAQGANYKFGSAKHPGPIVCLDDPEFSGGDSDAGWQDVDDVDEAVHLAQGVLLSGPAPNSIAEHPPVTSARHTSSEPTSPSHNNVEGEGGCSADLSPLGKSTASGMAESSLDAAIKARIVHNRLQAITRRDAQRTA